MKKQLDYKRGDKELEWTSVLERELESLFNRLGVDNKLSIPDYILGEYTVAALYLLASTLLLIKKHESDHNGAVIKGKIQSKIERQA
jgi:hypothetical protein